MLPALQTIGGLITGNKVLIKPDHWTGIIFEAFLWLLLSVGAPENSFNLWHGDPIESEKLIIEGVDIFRMT